MAIDTPRRADKAISDANERLATAVKRLANAGLQAKAASQDMAAIATEYASVASDIDDQVTADPTNPFWLAKQVEKAGLLAERSTIKTNADNIVAAVNAALTAVGEPTI